MEENLERFTIEIAGIPAEVRRRFLLAEKPTAYNVLLMHGSALCMDGQPIVFTAPSGTGKSTHTRLWREMFGSRVWMIYDDKPMLKITGEGVWAYGHTLERKASSQPECEGKAEGDSKDYKK